MPKSKRAKKSSSIPYARGFKPPTAKQRLKAMGLGEIAKEFQEGPDEEFFPPLPAPSSIDDWLAQYNETGQTYSKFLKECPWLGRRKVQYCRMTFNPDGDTLPEKYPNGKLYLLPLGQFEGGNCPAPSFSDLADYAECFFGQSVEILPAVQLSVDKTEGAVYWVEQKPSCHDDETTSERRIKRRSDRTQRHRLEARFHKESGNYQLQGNSLLLKIRQIMPADAICLMALTMSDIYDTPPDLFVAGLAAGNRRVGVFSFKRYDPTLTFSTEHWYQMRSKRGNEQEHSPHMTRDLETKVILQRSCKLLVHEIAHLLGLDHCIWYSCCMNGSGHLSEDFRQSMYLCPIDLRKLQHLCGFKVMSRYERLREFFKKHRLEEEASWMERRIEYIMKDRL